MAITIQVFPKLSPRIILIPLTYAEVTVQEVVNACKDWEDTEEGMDYTPLISASGKEELGGGVTVGITATLLNAKLMFAARSTPLETGTCTAASDGQTLTASAGQFVASGVYQGCTALNALTGSMAAIIEVVNAQELTTFQLSGGSRDTWLNTDPYVIYNNEQCALTGGNLVAVDSVGVEMSSIMQSPNTQVVRTSSASATLQELDAIQYSSYQNAVWVDITTSNTGVEYPIGTREYPVNNVADAITIGNSKGFSTLEILADLTIGSSNNINGFTINGKSHVTTYVNIHFSALAVDVRITNCTITGTLDGGTYIDQCIVDDLVYVNGHIHNSGLRGTISLDGNADAVFADCVTVDMDDAPIINMGGSGQDLAMPNYSGLLTITTLTGANNIGIGLNAGNIIIDSTVTNGTIIVSGIGMVTDNSTGSADVNTDGLMSRQTITEINWNKIHVDVTSSYSGTVFPTGTPGSPVNNITDAKAIANKYNINDFHLHGDVTLTGDWSGYILSADNYETCQVTCSNATLANTIFSNVRLTGSAASGEFTCNNCNLSAGFTNCWAVMENCELTGTFTLPATGYIKGNRCTSKSSSTIDMNDTTRGLWLANFSGVLAVTNCTDAGASISVTGHYVLTLAASCTAGSAMIAGVGTLDNSSTLTMINKTLPSTTWESSLSDHETLGTFGAELATKADIKASASTSYTVAVSGSVTYGTQDAGTFASTAIRDGSYWEVGEHADDGLTIECAFNIPSGDRAGIVTLFGHYIGSPGTTHHIELYAYNYESAGWEELEDVFMPGGNTSDEEQSHEYYERHIDSGEVKIRLVHHPTNYNASHTLYLDYLAVSSVDYVTATDVADTVWDTTIANHVGAGSTGAALNNVSAGATPSTIAAAVLEKRVSDHSGVSGSLANLMEFIYAIDGGRRRIIGNQEIFYKSDNITEVARFNLLDADGQPSTDEVYERTRA